MADLLRDQSARTTSRRELEASHEQFAQVSADVGELDLDAMTGAMEQDPDAGVELLAAMARATDARLRRRARLLAGELLLPLARHSLDRAAPGVRRLAPSAGGGVELDLDAAVSAVADAGGRTGAVSVGDLRWRAWQRPGRAYVLVVDASGSVTGRPLATALVTSAAVASRLGPEDELAVVAFWSRAVVLRPVGATAPPGSVLDAIFDLRGGDTTDLAGGLRAGLAEAGRAQGGAREVLVLTDGMANAGGDPVAVAGSASGSGATVHVLGLSGDEEAVRRCRALAGAGGGRFAPLLRARDAAAAVREVLEG